MRASCIGSNRNAHPFRFRELPLVRIEGKEVAKGKVPRSAPLTFTANDAFDVGRDSYSPVSLAYFDRKPVEFNGKIGSLNVRYLK